MGTLYVITNWVMSISWLALLVYSIPGTHRVVLGRPRKYDLLSVLYLSIAFSHLGFAAVRLVFWEVGKYPSVEVLARVIMSVFATVVAFVAISIIRHYRRIEKADQ